MTDPMNPQGEDLYPVYTGWNMRNKFESNLLVGSIYHFIKIAISFATKGFSTVLSNITSGGATSKV